MHIKALKELGIDLAAQAKKAKKKPIEDLVWSLQHSDTAIY
jgi:hypothetical protein